MIILRDRLLAGLIKTLAENQHNEYPQNIFEIGRTFEYDTTQETGVKETEHLGIVLCHEKTDFTEIRQILEALLSSLGLEFSVKESHRPSFIEGRIGEVLVKNQKIGIIGEIHPQVLTNFGLAIPVVGSELDLEKLFEMVK
ncbi:hypothetical protein J4444_03195 [Candidatus Woesearchaeota archaeon]|nr:hypothetical protein [Candidatus Woesearchaeota archaeon]